MSKNNLSLPETNRAVIYCRVSTREQVEEGNSLALQERLCREYCLKQGYTVDKVFIEQGESAKTADRKELQNLLNYCNDKKNRTRAVVVYKLDRFSRNTYDYTHYKVKLQSKGIEIKSVTEFFENSPAGKFMENIIANVAQFDNDVRTERCVGGMKEAIREGRYVWQAPIGYANTRMGGKATIKKSHAASIIQKTFEAVAVNKDYVEVIRKKMVEEGLLNNKGKPLSKSYFYKMLRNPVYAGWIVKFGERHKGSFTPIITDEVFEQVQRVLTYRTRKNFQYQVENPDFPLRRFIYYPSGSKLTGCWSKGRYEKYPYYRFLREKLAYRKELLEHKFMEHLGLEKYTVKEVEEFLKLIDRNYNQATAEAQKEAKLLEKQIKELKEKKQVIIHKNIEGVYSDQLFKEQVDLIEAELMETYAALSDKPVKNTELNKCLGYAEEYLRSPGAYWANASYEQKVALQWFNFPQGLPFDGEKFRTTQTASIFKVKETVQALQSPEVDLRRQSSNHAGDIQLGSWIDVGDNLLKLEEVIKKSKKIY